MRQSTPAPADEPNGPPPLVPADPETPKGRLVAAIWDEDVDAVGHVLDQNPNLASATLAHHGLLHRRWLGEVQRKEGFFLRDRSMLTEPAVIFAAKIPFYKNIYRSTRTISVESLAVLRLLVDRGASLRLLYPDPERWTKYGIFEACGQYDSPEAMNLLARAGAEVDIKRAWGPVGLGALALQYGAPRTLRALCDLGAAYVPFPDGLPGGSLEHFTPEPIVQAARSGHEDAIKVLLEQLDHSQWTRQISHGFDFPLTVLDAVLLAATDVLVPRDDVDEPIEPNRPWLGQIPWVVRQERLVHLLLDAGANPGATDSAGRTAFQCACRWAGDALIRRFSHAVPGGVDQQLPYLDWHDKGSYERETIRTGEKVTFLHVAAGYHNAAAVSCLLDVGAQVLCDEYGRTPLHWCFLTRDDFVQAEVRNMASLTQSVRELYEMEHWEQQIMPWAPSVDVIATLLPAVEDLRGRDASGPSVLHLAAQTRHWEAMAVLITKGFNPATRDEHGLTIFHLMVTAPKPAVGDPEHRAYMLGLEFLREVLRDRPDIGLNGAGPNGLTALHEACDLGHVLMAQLFLTLGAEPNCRDGVGWTPLCCVAASPCQDRGDALERLSPAEATDRRDKALYMKDMLLDAGADPTLRTDSGLTAEDIEHDIATKLADCVSRYAEDLYD